MDKLSDLPDNERCSVCGMPDNCGDCNHVSLSDTDLALLGLVR